MKQLFFYTITILLFTITNVYGGHHYHHLEHSNHAHAYHHTADSEAAFYQHFLKTVKHSQSIRTIVIDAGHGGKDSGCHGKKSHEKHITLKIALKLGQYIEEAFPEINVIYTREKDVFVPLFERAHIANKNRADLFISIHCNSAGEITSKSKKVQGTETFVMGLHTAKENLNVAKRENEVILLEKDYQQNYDGFDPNSPEGHIMLSMYQDAYLEQSINLADKIEKEFRTRAKRYSRGVKQAGFVVLRQTTMPSVLIEAGFLTNESEEKFLSSDYGQTLIASGIYRAFKAYKKEIDPTMVLSVGENTAKGDAPLAKFAKGVVYKVQLGASSQLVDLKTGDWQKVKQIEVQKINGMYKYLVGEYESYADCLKAQKYWKTHGFKDAFVVAYQDGERISIAKAKEIKGK